MIFIVIWVGIAILCAVIAANKHRSAVGWLFLGLIFGIFALILIVVLGDPRPQTIVIHNQVAAAVGVPPSPAAAAMPREPVLIEAPRRAARVDAVEGARHLEAAVIALRTLAEAADGIDARATDHVLTYLESENGDEQYTRKEADRLVQWISGLPRDESSIRAAINAVASVVQDRPAFLDAVDRLEGRQPNDRQERWATFLRRKLGAVA